MPTWIGRLRLADCYEACRLSGDFDEAGTGELQGGSKINRTGYAGFGVYVSTSQGNPFWSTGFLKPNETGRHPCSGFPSAP